MINKQKIQLKKQLERHKRNEGTRKIILDEQNDVKLNLLIKKGVFASDMVSGAIHLARFLYQHQDIYQDKKVLDMGCGPGTQGIIAAKYGAKSVVLADINPKAVENTRKNLERLEIKNGQAVESDLFNNIGSSEPFDIIIFNHPFFPFDPKEFEQDPIGDEMLKRSMMSEPSVLESFFKQVEKYLTSSGVVIMPYFHMAGTENSPERKAEEYNLQIKDKFNIDSDEGLQQGDVSIYLITT